MLICCLKLQHTMTKCHQNQCKSLSGSIANDSRVGYQNQATQWCASETGQGCLCAKEWCGGHSLCKKKIMTNWLHMETYNKNSMSASISICFLVVNFIGIFCSITIVNICFIAIDCNAGLIWISHDVYLYNNSSS